MILTSSWTIHL